MNSYNIKYRNSWLASLTIAFIVYASVAQTQAVTDKAKQTRMTAVEWYSLACNYAKQGEALRKSRMAGDVSNSEWETINGIYQNWKNAAEQAVALDPNYENAWYELSSAATFSNDRVRAGIALWKAQALDKRDYRVYWWGLEMFQQKWGGDYTSLQKVAHLCTTIDFPTDSQVYALATELHSAGFENESRLMAQKAIVRYKANVRDHPSDASLHATLGNILVEQNMQEQAVPELQAAVRLDPNLDKPHLQLGVIYAARHRYTDAAAQFREAIRTTDAFDAKVDLASSLVNSGQWEDAEKLLNSLTATKPGEDRLWSLLGQVFVHKQHVDEAIAAYKKSEEISSDSLEPHRQLSLLYTQSNQTDKAVEEGEEAVRLGPDDLYSNLYLAGAYALKQENDLAVRVYRRAIELNAHSSEAHLELGGLLLKMGKKDEAIAHLKQVLNLKPSAEQAKSARELLDKNP